MAYFYYFVAKNIIGYLILYFLFLKKNQCKNNTFKALDLLDLLKAKILCIYELKKVNIIGKHYKLIFAIFYIVLL